MTHERPTLLSLGHGYSARALAARLIPEGWRVLGTGRRPETRARIAETGVEPLPWEAEPVTQALREATHLLVSAGPDDEGDPSLRLLGEAVADKARDLYWAGYLSTTGVYGDHHGAWVDETTPLAPTTRRGEMRVAAEAAWGAIPHLPLHVFRLAGIYGPGRGPFEKVREGRAERVVKPGQVFSRIHVDDIAQVLAASIERPNPGAVYNVCDDDPAPPQDVIAHAAELLGLPVPPEVPFEEADMSPMARSFYSDNKRVANDRIKAELGVELIHPDYRSGLRALLEAEPA
ncbi:SDR family oxidoreductase [Roseivivax isoporae]|uniref:Epimerase n=1 Tax=Roseivivax isoporae LMG 25204 TaxID=1449351 RepID=X7F7C4_9RHOB|nr:SDR family oxidoreductase [Roseivivax isoporae]ETX27991.1 epimerase [Roseivivax isoporae LMG 25204]